MKKLNKTKGKGDAKIVDGNKSTSVDDVELVPRATSFTLDELQNFDYENYNIIDTASTEDDTKWNIDTKWNYISSDGIMFGPFTTAELIPLYIDNNINAQTCIDRNTLVRSLDGMQSWRRLYEMRE